MGDSPEFRDLAGEQADAWRMLRRMTAAGAIACGVVAAVYFAIGADTAAWSTLACGVFLAAHGLVMSPARPGLAMLVASAGALVGAASASTEIGGLAAPVAPWVAMLPVMATTVAGRKIGALVVGLTAFTVLIIHATSDGTMAISAEQHRLALLLSMLSLLAFGAFLSMSQARLRETAWERLREAHDAMARARDQAEATSRHKGEFVATVSHELRTPLVAMVGATDLLLHGSSLSDEQRECARVAREAAGTLSTLVNDILDLSRIDAGAMRLATAPCDPAMVAHGAAQLVALRAREKGLGLAIDVPDTLPRVLLDGPRLRQVITNLLDNAVKFTPNGQVSLRASAETLTVQKLRLRFEVEDTGVGIAPEMHEPIFERFRQVDASSTRRHGGSGLGLAIARELAELMGGTLSVRSRPGEGATFTVELVADVVDDDAKPV